MRPREFEPAHSRSLWYAAFALAVLAGAARAQAPRRDFWVRNSMVRTAAPGVYMLRLTRGDESLTARAVVIR